MRQQEEVWYALDVFCGGDLVVAQREDVERLAGVQVLDVCDAIVEEGEVSEFCQVLQSLNPGNVVEGQV